MKTQIQLYVKNETFYTRFFGGGLWFINIFRKLPVEITFQGKVRKLKPQREPYVYDVEPGSYDFFGKDPRALTKKADKAVTGALLGAGMMGGAGGSVLTGAMMGASASQDNIFRDGSCHVTVKDGDILKIPCQANKKGAVVFRKVG